MSKDRVHSSLVDYVNENTSKVRRALVAKQSAELSHPSEIEEVDRQCLDPDPTVNVAVEERELAHCKVVKATLSPVLPSLATKSNATLTEGDKVAGRYVIVSRLPTSGMGQVFKALDRDGDETNNASHYVALKFSTEEAVDADAEDAAVRNEFRRLSKMKHRNIVRVIDIGVHNNMPFIVMEWLDGKSLLQILDEQSTRRMALKRAQGIIRSIANGLAYAHENNIVHGDIKPSNVFITERGDTKILDFGAAPVCDDDAADQIWATRAYASVNVLSGSVAAKSDDVYSLGVTAYLLLSGKRPFGARDAIEALREHSEPEPLPHDASEAWPAVRSALSFDESLRQTDARQFLADYVTENRKQDIRDVLMRNNNVRYAAAAALTLLLVATWWIRLDHRVASDIRTDLRQAGTAMQLGMLVEPDSESALHFYRQVLAKSPQNPEALNGLGQIASQLLMRAGDSLDDGDLETARQNLETAEQVSPGHPAIPHVAKLVDRHATDLVARAEQIANTEPGEAEFLLQSAERLSGGETDRIAALRARMLAAKIDHEMDQLIAGIDERILAERLAVPKGDSAIDLLRQARELQPQDRRIPLAANRIASALLFQALFAISNDNLDNAAVYLDAAKSLNVRHLAMARAEYELAKARNRAEQAKYAAERSSR